MKKVIALIIALLGLLEGLGPVKDEWIVGEDIDFGDITEFYYTVDASTYPPFYQRYHFYAEDGDVIFYHETREGGGWPQTDEDITACGGGPLTDAQLERLNACLAGGVARAREESLETGDSGPWLYLYWNGDAGVNQEFSFASSDKLYEFVAFCEELAAMPETRS